MAYRKKLIEVSLPLEAINKESMRDIYLRGGHPRLLHIWWSRKPLATCLAVIFSSLVEDPSNYINDRESADKERVRLFSLLEDLIKWENRNNEEIFYKAQLEIARSVARSLDVEVPIGRSAVIEFLEKNVPPIIDPFAGGGSIPFEAQQLGLQSQAFDINPVAVIINKAMMEIPSQFSNNPPIHPNDSNEDKKNMSFWEETWQGAEGLAEDVRYYGRWVYEQTFQKVGYLYPKICITPEYLTDQPNLTKQGLKLNTELNVISWIWYRTVICPNPACHAQMPLTSKWWLSTRKNNEAWIDPTIECINQAPIIHYNIKIGPGDPPKGTVNRKGAYCIACKSPVTFDYIRAEGKAGRMSSKVVAIVAESHKGRNFFPINQDHDNISSCSRPEWVPDTELPNNPRDFKTPNYGLRTFADLFTERQLTTLNVFTTVVKDTREKIIHDAKRNGRKCDLENDERIAAYAKAIITYLAFAVDRLAVSGCSLATWNSKDIKVQRALGRQVLPMTWDFAEVNFFGHGTGNYIDATEMVAEFLASTRSSLKSIVRLGDATSDIQKGIITTDPPYYDNIGYGDLSDFFYVWLRKMLLDEYPELFSTLLVPKQKELVATPYRFDGSIEKAKTYFEDGLRKTFKNMLKKNDSRFPTVLFYAFKQSEDIEQSYSGEEEFVSTGWETMLNGLVEAGFQIKGTWPLRTEMISWNKGGINALASSIVIVCYPRADDAIKITRRDFLSFLKHELSLAIHELQKGSIAPVDLAQAAIGPGMAIFSRYKEVLETDGSAMRVRTALILINQVLDEYLAEQEGEYDGDTRWALAWFEQYGHDQGPYGVAETLSKAKNTSVEGLSHAGFLEARSGKVRLLKRDELDAEWDPVKDKRLTAWEAAQYLIRSLDKEGEKSAGALLDRLGSFGETARDLAYRLYTICERKGWAQEALAYNMLVVSWPRIKEQSGKGPKQDRML